MSLSKQAMRDAVRSQLDTDEEELPNGRLDLYLADAFQRTVQRERKWPFLQFEWELQILDGAPTQWPADLASIDHIYQYGFDQLAFLDHGSAEEAYGRDGTIGQSQFYSLRNGKIYLWPAPSADTVTLLITGYRRPADFLTAGAGDSPDCDDRLHLSLVWYACALAQAANEDEVLDSLYYKQWDDGVAVARSDIMRPDPGRARIVNGGLGKLKSRYLSWRYPT